MFTARQSNLNVPRYKRALDRSSHADMQTLSLHSLNVTRKQAPRGGSAQSCSGCFDGSSSPPRPSCGTLARALSAASAIRLAA